MKRITLRIYDDDLARKIRLHCAQTDRSQNDTLCDLLRSGLGMGTQRGDALLDRLEAILQDAAPVLQVEQAAPGLDDMLAAFQKGARVQ